MTKPTGNPPGRPAKPTQRTLQLQELWLRGAQERVEIPCGTKAAAVAVRFQLYNAVRVVRADPGANPELAEVVAETQVSFLPDDPTTLVIERSRATQALNAVFAALGVTGAVPETKTEEDVAMDASLEKLRAMLDAGGSPGTSAEDIPRTTPYYTR